MQLQLLLLMPLRSTGVVASRTSSSSSSSSLLSSSCLYICLLLTTIKTTTVTTAPPQKPTPTTTTTTSASSWACLLCLQLLLQTSNKKHTQTFAYIGLLHKATTHHNLHEPFPSIFKVEESSKNSVISSGRTCGKETPSGSVEVKGNRNINTTKYSFITYSIYITARLQIFSCNVA